MRPRREAASRDLKLAITCSQRKFAKNCFYDQHATIFFIMADLDS